MPQARESAPAIETLPLAPQVMLGALERAPIMVVWSRADGRIIYVNAQACETLGYTREEMVRLRVPDLVVEFDPARFEAHNRELDTRGRHNFELTHRAKDGRQVPVAVQASRMMVNGEMLTCAYVADISERKRVEEELQRSQRMDSLGRLASGIAHDLRNMLSPVLLGAQVLQGTTRDPESWRILGEMCGQINRCNNLLNQLLVFARGSDGHRERLSLVPILEETLAFCVGSFPRGVEVTTQLPQELPEVMGNPTQLEQVVMNLLVNARDAMPEGGRLEIALGEGPELEGALTVAIRVSDSGVGIPASLQERIFEPFFTSKPPGQGTGLGLSTTLGIVRGHGGRIHVESNPGQGSCFTVLLPIAS